MANLYEFITSLSYVFVRSAYAPLTCMLNLYDLSHKSRSTGLVFLSFIASCSRISNTKSNQYKKIVAPLKGEVELGDVFNQGSLQMQKLLK